VAIALTKKRNEPPAPFQNPIPIFPQLGRTASHSRLNLLPRPQEINYKPTVLEIQSRNGIFNRGARRGARNAGRGRGQARVPVAEPELDP
jgi:hypothetical protein